MRHKMLRIQHWGYRRTFTFMKYSVIFVIGTTLLIYRTARQSHALFSHTFVIGLLAKTFQITVQESFSDAVRSIAVTVASTRANPAGASRRQIEATHHSSLPRPPCFQKSGIPIVVGLGPGSRMLHYWQATAKRTRRRRRRRRYLSRPAKRVCDAVLQQSRHHSRCTSADIDSCGSISRKMF